MIGFDNQVYTHFWNGQWNADWFPLPGQHVFDHEQATDRGGVAGPSNLDLFRDRLRQPGLHARSGTAPVERRLVPAARPARLRPQEATDRGGVAGPGNLDLFVIGFDNRVYSTFWGPILDHFTFADDISAANRMRLIECHRDGLFSVGRCGNLNEVEKQRLREVYARAIHHTTLNEPGVNASAAVGGSTLNVNFGVLFPQGDEEIAQTLIHEMMHCAGFSHPARRDPPPGSSCAAPNPAVFDCPNDNGVYYGTAPLRAEFCIAGDQSDVRGRLTRKAAQESCTIDEQGVARIRTR